MSRLLIKISGEMLNQQHDVPYVASAIKHVAEDILQIRQSGHEVAVVIGGGNIWRGKDREDLAIPKVSSDFLGITATLMNAVVLGQTILGCGGDAVVYGPPNMIIPTGSKAYDIIAARDALSAGKIVVCAGGIFQPYATTDSAAIQRSLELECTTVIKTTKVDGLYDKDPHVHTDASRFSHISYDEALRLQVAVMDQAAFALARDNAVDLYICHMDDLATITTNHINGTHVSVD